MPSTSLQRKSWNAPQRKRGLLTLVLVLNLGALGLFKYLGFFGELLGCTGVQLSLPQLAPANRHFVLHVRHLRLYDRRVPRS